MSDESQPEPLRLKPRVQPPADQPPGAPAAPAGSTGEATGGSEVPRLRLKPKLSGDAGGAAAGEPAATPPTEPAATQPRLKPRLTVSTDSEAAAEPTAATPASDPTVANPAEGKGFTLKPKLRPKDAATSGADQPSAAGGTPAAPPTSGSPVPSPVAPAPDPSMAPPIVPAPPGLTFPPPPPRPAAKTAPAHPPPPPFEVPPGLPPPHRPPEHGLVFKLAVIGVAMLVAGILGVGGYFAYQAFTSTPATVSPPAAKTPSPSPKTTPATADGEPASPAKSAQGKMVEKAKAAIAAHDQSREAGMASVLEEPPPTSGASTPIVPATVPPAESGLQADTPPPAPVETAPAAVPASEAFRAWVSRARISGVRGGAEARAFINDRVIRRGETVDEGLGITFEGVDPQQNILLFKDQSGAQLGKKF